MLYDALGSDLGSCEDRQGQTLKMASSLENPRDRGAWWPAVYGVTQSRTWLKQLSSSSSSSLLMLS